MRMQARAVPDCPLRREGKGCRSEANLWSHFAHRHPQGTVRIGGACPPKCRLCGLQTRAAGSLRHEQTDKCRKLVAQRRRGRLAAEVSAAAERKFTAYQKDTLRSVEEFKYLGRIIARDDCDTPAIRRNLKRARQVWGRISKVITKEEVPPRVAGMFYQAVVAAVLLYGSETWCLTDTARRPLDGFHTEAARRITGKMPRKVRQGGEEQWVYPHTAEVLAAAGLQPLRHYIDKRRNTIWKSVRNRPTLAACRRAERREGTPRRLNWWNQTMDYTGEGKGKEAESTGGLNGPALPARSPPAPPPPPARRAPAPPRRPRSPVELMDTAEQEALDTLWRAAHFHD